MPTQRRIHRLLILDDDPVMRDLLEAVLAIAGYVVTSAISGHDALALLAGGSAFDAVLTDLRLPQLEGDALVHALREALPPSTLLVGMSGSAPSSELRSLLDAFLPKPFDSTALAAALEAAQQRDRHTDRLRSTETAATPNEVNAPSAVILDDAVFASLAKIIPASQLEQLYEMTLNDISRRHALIEQAALSGDLDTVHREAHAIKGSCGMVGATELHKIAAKVESATTLDAGAGAEIPAASARLRRMLSAKLHPS